MMERLPTHLEATGIVRVVEAGGGFATVLRKGDRERGSLLIMVASRGRHVVALERIVSLNGGYDWHRVGPPESAGSIEIADFVAKRARFDEDSWILELDVADPERFIAETTSGS